MILKKWKTGIYTLSFFFFRFNFIKKFMEKSEIFLIILDSIL